MQQVVGGKHQHIYLKQYKMKL